MRSARYQVVPNAAWARWESLDRERREEAHVRWCAFRDGLGPLPAKPRHGDDLLIYSLVDPRDGSAFYVGCTNNPHERLRRHVGESLNWAKAANRGSRKQVRIFEIVASGALVAFVALDVVRAGSGAHGLSVESHWIGRLLSEGAPLTNERPS